jgi:hypothetical protein
MSGFSAIGTGSDAVQNAQLGINRGMANLDRDAQVIAQGSAAAPDNGDGMIGALVDAQVQKLSVEASARALSIVDQTLGTLLDIKA